MDKNNIIVSIICLAYNHEKYIRQCLEGFIMQKTNFTYEVIIHDDASTDKTATIIKEYESKFPNIIKPIYQKENQYSKGIKIGDTFLYPKARGKYIAECEGDDYWIDPLKLQKQVDFLEENPNYTMCCSDAIIKTTESILDWSRYPQNQDVLIEDIIINGGWFIQTASLIYRKNILDKYPDYCKNCHVGDYPIMLWAGINGKIRWFAEKQVIYHYSMGNSWTSRIKKENIANLILGWRSEIDMLSGLDSYSKGKYTQAFRKRKVSFIHKLTVNHPQYYNEISTAFQDVKQLYNKKEIFEDYFIKIHLYNEMRKIKQAFKYCFRIFKFQHNE
ncbi:MAG: glycosyltransferase [Bacteroidaceae bacterium]|nr:glycosyltransferase [Bacteroidaceae bacterium]